MRLINAKTLKLEEFWDETQKQYAILSHRWQDEEVSFQDMQDLAKASTLKGFSKIREVCRLALENQLEYAWVDTCCINKDSSAELTEALNSMLNWYGASKVCCAYLFDTASASGICVSEWFARGWTLQELIAPSQLLGCKKELNPEISMKTGIKKAVLEGAPVQSYSIAQRMSWAAGRTTTRVEDTAYCLLGLFDVNMPLLYGEGRKAFI